MYSCVDLVHAAERFVQKHFMEVVQHDEFVQIDSVRMLELLRCDQLLVTSEQQVFAAVERWVAFAPELRAQLVCELLQHIRLPLLDTEFLENKVLTLDHIRNCAHCQHLVASAIRLQADGVDLERIAPRCAPQGIFVVGGRNSLDCQLKSMERYDFANNEWLPVVNRMQIYITYMCTFEITDR